MNNRVPKWVDIMLIPMMNLTLALMVTGLVVLAVGESPVEAMRLLITGALGSARGIGYTLYYTTSFIFTGLAVAVAFHARMFNIGGEGQASVGGVGVALVCMTMGNTYWLISLPVAIIAAALFGAAWAAIPAYLQAKRGSHVVITTIMFNFIAAALMNYLLRTRLKAEGSMALETEKFGPGTHLPEMKEMASWIGLDVPNAPMNVTFFVAVLCCYLVWLLIWRTRLGYEIRAFGQSEPAAIYAGISPFKIIMIAMLISGALAGMMSLNTVMGQAQRLLLDHVQGAGFVGIAVALMGRSHPVGVFLAALLFGILYQGGAELSFEMPAVGRDMVVVIQALIILFTGALDNLIRFPVEKFFLRRGT